MGAVVTHLAITGNVQGVGFRAWLRDEAEAVGITGWVRNRRDGSVEALLAGEAEVVRALIERCRSGPRGSVVTRIDDTPSAEPAPAGFRILPAG